MVAKGGYSFVAMLVINPVVILFYQNCSMAPISYASKDSFENKVTISREVASESTQLKSDKCNSAQEKCPHSKSE